MPSNQIKENKAMEVGSLVATTRSIPVITDEMPMFDTPIDCDDLPEGSVGIILKRPTLDKPRQFLVSFVGSQELWVFHSEIEPYHMREKNV